MKIGLVGLPNVGKSTLFNALTKSKAQAENYPFCTIDPNIGIVTVPDERLDVLSDMYETLSKVPATVEFVDIAGLVKNAGKGEGLGNQFLSHIRSVNAILEIVRCFDNDNITHVDGSVDPVRDVETINYELIFSDLEMIEKRIKTVQKNAMHGNKDDRLLYELLQSVQKTLMDGSMVDVNDYPLEQQLILQQQNFLTTKPILYAANVNEDELTAENEYVKRLRAYLKENNPSAPLVTVSAKIEAEIAQLEPDEREMFLEELGMDQSGLNRVIRCGYDMLELITFFTAGKKECRAWKIRKGTKAPQAAGTIHSDFERGFIRAEVTKYDKLVEAGNDVRAKELAYTRIEGKDYIVQDGDVIYFRFNV